LALVGKRVSLNPSVTMLRFHSENDLFFGYYDLNPLRNSKILAHEIVGNWVNLKSIHIHTKIEQTVGSTRAWNYQQGARLGWAGNGFETIFYNSINDDSGEIIVRDLVAGTQQSFPFLLQVANKKFDKVIGVDMIKINQLNPEYGYPDPSGRKSSESDTSVGNCGILGYEIKTGHQKCIVSLDSIVAHEKPDEADTENSEINHITYSPDETKISFIHRWYPLRGPRASRLMVFDLQNNSLLTVISYGMVSHYCWESEESIFVYGRIKDGSDRFISCHLSSGNVKIHEALNDKGDGHPSLSPSGNWLVIDSYPNIIRKQSLFLYHLKSGEIINIGRFFSPKNYSFSMRCDLHPRWCNSSLIAIDTTFGGKREIGLLDISGIV